MVRIVIAKQIILFVWVVKPFSFWKAYIGSQIRRLFVQEISEEKVGVLRSNWYF